MKGRHTTIGERDRRIKSFEKQIFIEKVKWEAGRDTRLVVCPALYLGAQRKSIYTLWNNHYQFSIVWLTAHSSNLSRVCDDIYFPWAVAGEGGGGGWMLMVNLFDTRRFRTKLYSTLHIDSYKLNRIVLTWLINFPFKNWSKLMLTLPPPPPLLPSPPPHLDSYTHSAHEHAYRKGA